jgi:hypothetical protein
VDEQIRYGCWTALRPTIGTIRADGRPVPSRPNSMPISRVYKWQLISALGGYLSRQMRKIVVRAIITKDFHDAVMGVLIAKIKTLVSSCFISFECSSKGRDCNRPAHELVVLGHLCT